MKNRFLSFKAFIAYFAVVFLVATAAIMLILTAYLAEYEKYQPSTLSDSVLDAFMTRDNDALYNINADEKIDRDIFDEYLSKVVNPDSLFCYKSSSGENTLVYDYISNNKKIASLELLSTGEKSPRGFDVYEISKIIWHRLFKYTVTASDDVNVIVNGKILDKSSAKVLSTNESYKDFDSYVSSVLLYEPREFYIPDISANSDSSLLISVESDGDDSDFEVNFTVKKSFPEDMLEDVKNAATEGVKAYVYYTTLHTYRISGLLPHIHPKSQLYKNVQLFDNTWSNSKTSDRFTKFDISDPVIYTDSKVSLRMDVVYEITKYYNTIREFDFNFDVYLEKDGDKWYIVALERIIKE